MAEFDFGDSELFQQLDDSSLPLPSHIRFTDQDADQEDTFEFKEKLGEFEEMNQRLIEENQDLKRKLRILSRPSGLIVDNVKTDGPLLQILFANNSISKQCRQEIEDCICSVIQKHQQQAILKSSSYSVSPQASSFDMEEDVKSKTTCNIKTVTEAFSMVGSVLYFTTFCLDKLGQPLANENPQLTDGWAVPTYQQVFNQVIAVDGQEVQIKEKRSKPSCFNCGLTDHQLRDCPTPKDMNRINEKRKEFSQGGNNQISGNQRYHVEEVEERFAKYKPGVLSEDLLDALGVDMNTLPPFIYRMRQLGYPPGWLKEAESETSGLTLYDGNVSSDAEPTEENKISYDVSKLVDFPGFNVSPAPSVKDDYRLFGSVPMQPNHLKENYAAYLSSAFTTTGSICNKRQHEFESTPHQTKKRRSNSDSHSSDMDVDSDYGPPRHHRNTHGFQFQPPLPPGSPSFGSPPPLPQNTPPATPTPPPLPKGTPPVTPTNGSPALRGRAWGNSEEAGAGAGAGAGEEDALTLEELEEQQRLIWAALENADTATNSDSETPASDTPASDTPASDTPASDTPASDTPASDTPASATPVPSSPSISTPVHMDTETEMEEGEAEEEQKAVEVPGGNQAAEGGDDAPAPVVKPSGVVMEKEESPQSPEPMRVLDDSPESPALKQTPEESPESPVPMQAQEETPLSPLPVTVRFPPLTPEPGQALVESELSDSAGKVSAVPHRSKFAEGIIAFEDTPEYTEVAEATGTYLRIRDLLKGSPRNLSKNKK